ncbi:hypothetical protein GH714_035173 [Hevea brasiliensis]|uniref:Alpha-1,4 glucan phosphorylase n=1 Tax=Hevea brasiliensis TaxID=3981 RepID=A0A6A6MJ97_HEVBR|nr:hypothetical protein GH714_035173 [Hevea brasiliensis]
MATKKPANGTSAYVSAVSCNIPAAANPLAEDPLKIASNINYHAQFNPHFSLSKFEPKQAFYATAESVRDRLLQVLQVYSSPKKCLYLSLDLCSNGMRHTFVITKLIQSRHLSMEFLQGRALTNAIGNLNIQGAYADALSKLGHELEEIVEQEKDAALGNGGLGRLASCFLDSMATLNLPAWGYGLRYRYGLFKQRITKEGREEIAEDWLEKFSPWVVVRHGVVFLVRFFGHVQVNPDGSRKWLGGEIVQALDYDVPIPGYKTKNTISLRLWEARASAEDFNLFQFNDGQYESAAQLHTRAQQICAVLYPGDATEEGKLLRLKQQLFVCSASLQNGIHFEDISDQVVKRAPDALSILIFSEIKERRTGKGSGKWSEFPSKVAVQLNDTHPTLAIPELMTIAYTNHTVLPEALEKWSQTVMWKLLPRHMEIIEEIDKRFIALISSSRTDLESTLPSMCILDNDPKKPVVRMANLCVVFTYDNADFQTEWASAKMANKQPLARYILQVTGVSIDSNSLFDIQVKRIHEYKRQLLNILGAVYRYKKLQEMSPEERKNTTPRTVMVGGKAFATYTNAKRIVKLVNDVGAVVNGDPEVNNYLKFKLDPRFEEAKKFIRSGAFGSYDYNPLLDSLEGNTGCGRGDYFLVGHDFSSYLDAQKRVDEAYKDHKRWLKMSILSTAGSGKFSSDRTSAQYAKEI